MPLAGAERRTGSGEMPILYACLRCCWLRNDMCAVAGAAQRWGRSYESYGEDPLAIFVLGESYIQGLQFGPGAAGVTAKDNPHNFKKIGSVAKHLSAYNFEGCIGAHQYPYCEQYREFFNAVVSEADLQETYWLAWRRLAPALSGAMCSYNALNGVPACADKEVMTTLMRQTWNFTGSIVSDDGAVTMIRNVTTAGNVHGHGYANSSAGAAAAALDAGCDVDYGGGYSAGAQAAVDQGLTSESVLAAAVRRSLSTRLRLGEFDRPMVSGFENPWNSRRLHLGVVDSDEHRALAWRAAVSSAVLLENAAGLLGLPIISSDPTGTVVAVLGEGADDAHAIVNRYTGTQQRTCTLLAGIRDRAATDGMVVRHSVNDTRVAIGASVIVVVVRSEDEGESHDRANLTMRAEDQDTLLRLQQQQAKSGRPATKVVVVVISGGPVDTSEPAEVMKSGFVTSVIAVWQPGEEGGNALAALLWGDVDFSGALAVTAYRQAFTGARGIANISLAGRGYRYLNDQSLQLYPYGFGLCYSNWSKPALSWVTPGEVPASNIGRVAVAVRIQNMGTRVGSRPLLLFVQRLPSLADRGAKQMVGVNWPNKWLVAFGKARDVQPAQEQIITLAFGAEEMSRWVPPGGFAVLAGRYLLTAVDERGEMAANLTLTVSGHH